MRPRNNVELVNKDRVLLKFVQTCEQVGAATLLDVKQDSPLVQAVDMILQHGLKDPIRGYWFLVRSLTHSSTLKSLEAFVKYISSSQQKGLAWTFYTLDEGSIEYYLSSLAQDQSTLQQHYLELSVLRDRVLSQQVVTVLSNLRAEAAAIQASMETSLVSELDYLVNSTPSLPSPVDSGVALLDSDTSTCDMDKHEVFSSTQCDQDSWKLDVAGSVDTRTSTSSNTTLADPSDLQNCNTIHAAPAVDNKPKPGIIAQSKVEGVCRRPRKKKKSESGKRVSFHQDYNDNSDNNMNKFYVEGRYSWGGEGDSFYFKEANNIRLVKSEVYENKALTSNINIFESEMAIEADCESSTTTLEDAKINIEIVCEKLTNVVKQSLGLKSKERGAEGMPERGVPEGQEDPCVGGDAPMTGQSSLDCTSDSEWSLDTADKLAKKQFPRVTGFQRSTPNQPNWPTRILYEAPSKTSLVKRFLRSIPVRKPYKEKKKQPKHPSLYIKGVKPDPALCQDLCVKLETEIKSNKPVKMEGDEVITVAMKSALEETVVLNRSEKIYKVYRVASTEGIPLLAVLTDSSIYMTGLNRDNSYTRRHHIPYTSLDSVVIGPECQTVMLVTVDPSVSVTVISALGHTVVTHMVTHLAVAVCRVTHSHLSVSQLSLSSMQALYKAVLSQTSVTKDEKLLYYRYIRVEDSYVTSLGSTQGCHKTGHLMYRSHNHSPWLPGYILLKGGILYVFTDTNSKRPKHVLSFHVGYFGGCRRVQNSNRPHTFEILPFSQRGLYGTFQFAAADDYEASEWLQAFIQTSSCVSESSVRGGCSDPVVGCGLLLTSRHLITLDFPDRVLSSARLQDITSIHTDTTCCILETSCREVQNSSGDWILYFLTEQAISEFLDMMYTLRPELKEAVVTEWECEALRSHCVQTSRLVRAAWDPLLQPCLKHRLR